MNDVNRAPVSDVPNKGTPAAELFCPKCYHLNPAHVEVCVHCQHSLYVKCDQCGHLNFRGLDLCQGCHKPLRHINIFHIKPGVKPSLFASPNLLRAYSAAFLVGCFLLLGLIISINKVMDYYAHKEPPIEKTLGLPPYQEPGTTPTPRQR